ncbi:MAG TPA: hypothetical protein DHW50_05985 [Akkermansia sp.]|uniref:Uncharacterized protein n=1 Tax=Akkermansia massiliensis TaxID=2927224 RepID=A0AAE6W2H0_9BACT|nr:hypothetical protein CXU18_11450 [Akkermansia muciniphila]QHV63507.1 hypothetical protein DMI76_09100 [Akkermansia massiliensis]HCL33197.1 hypothetical protein [Akkermansia sp.]PNC48969.1 hypothetical protein CXU15_10305 [Akkermansia muciniphila]PNC50790.1 hypothetical protein CXU11_01885 [Akkermansia muciniphila]
MARRSRHASSSAASRSETKQEGATGGAAASDGAGRGLTGLLRAGRGVPSSSGGHTPKTSHTPRRMSGKSRCVSWLFIPA